MNIKDIKWMELRIPTVREHVTSHGTYGGEEGTEHVIIAIYTDTDIIGLGEASLIDPQFQGETVETVVTIIREYLRPVIVGEDPQDTEKINERMDRAIKGHDVTKNAIDIALWDSLGKQLETPIYDLLGGRYRDKTYISWSLASGDIDGDIMEAKRVIQDRNIKILNIKVGIDPDFDLKRVALLRESLGSDVRFRLDVNEGWRPSTAIKILKKMERYEIDWVEQPVPRWDLDGMARIRKALNIPVVADESIFTPQDAINLIKSKAADVFILKNTKSGITNSKKILAIADAAGIPCIFGDMLATSIGRAAVIHLATSAPNVIDGSHVFSSIFLKEDIVTEPLMVQKNFIRVPTKPGLGVILQFEKRNLLRPL